MPTPFHIGIAKISAKRRRKKKNRKRATSNNAAYGAGGKRAESSPQKTDIYSIAARKLINRQGYLRSGIGRHQRRRIFIARAEIRSRRRQPALAVADFVDSIYQAVELVNSLAQGDFLGFLHRITGFRYSTLDFYRSANWPRVHRVASKCARTVIRRTYQRRLRRASPVRTRRLRRSIRARVSGGYGSFLLSERMTFYGRILNDRSPGRHSGWISTVKTGMYGKIPRIYAVCFQRAIIAQTRGKDPS